MPLPVSEKKVEKLTGARPCQLTVHSRADRTLDAPVISLAVGALDATVGGESVLQGVQLPARVSELDTGLSDLDADDFTHV